MGFFRKIVNPKSQDKQEKRESSTNCPYCGTVLDEIPKRKAKCINCGNFMYVRNGELVTEEQATIREWVKRLESLGLTESEFDIQRKDLTNRFGHTPSINDTIWKFLNTQLATTKNLSLSKLIYLEMARLASLEGKDSIPYLAEAAKHDLLEHEAMGVTKVQVVNVNDHLVCPECRKLEGRVFTIKEALEKMSIPYSCQNQEGCRCWYSAID